MSQEINLLNPALLPRRDALGFEAVAIATAVSLLVIGGLYAWAGSRADAVQRHALVRGRHHGSDGLACLLVGVGRFAVEKRWDVLLRGFFRWRASGGRGRLVLCGDGPERARMTAMIEGRDDVALRGFVKDRAELARVLATADALVHACPSV